MANDFKGKEPTKNERMMFELAMQQQQMERALWSTSSLGIASAILNDVDPEKLAELLVYGDEKLKEYSKKVNEAIKKLEAKHEHNHEGHSHTEGEGHEHDGESAESEQEPQA